MLGVFTILLSECFVLVRARISGFLVFQAGMVWSLGRRGVGGYGVFAIIRLN